MCDRFEKPTEPILYFAYGSNLNTGQMRERCPSATVAFKARAEGWRLCFPRYSENRAGGVASLEPADSSTAWGVIYSLTWEDWEALNRREGFQPGRPCAENTYCWVSLHVLDEAGQSHEVGTYLANTKRDYRPSRKYLSLITSGAKEHGFPGDYRTLLEQVPTKMQGKYVEAERFKAQMIDRHRPAFDLWRRCHELLEDAVVRSRVLSSPLFRALDILFVQSFKSHGSLYFLCVHGHGEDGATILRRMLEIAFQTRYLYADPDKRQDRAHRYLAWFWLQAEGRIKGSLSEKQRTWWQSQFEAHKHLILKPSGRPPRNWWGDSTIKSLAKELGFIETYDQDYRFLSQMAHCTAQGILMERRGDIVGIRTDMLVREILIFGTKYMIEVARIWNENSALLDTPTLANLAKEAVDFDFSAGESQ